MKATYKRAAPYADDALNLPVADVDAAIPFYQTTFGFSLVSRKAEPYKSAVLARDAIQIGLAENGGVPTQEGCFFEVDNLDAALRRSRARREQSLIFGSIGSATPLFAFSSSSRLTVCVTCSVNARNESTDYADQTKTAQSSRRE